MLHDPADRNQDYTHPWLVASYRGVPGRKRFIQARPHGDECRTCRAYQEWKREQGKEARSNLAARIVSEIKVARRWGFTVDLALIDEADREKRMQLIRRHGCHCLPIPQGDDTVALVILKPPGRSLNDGVTPIGKSKVYIRVTPSFLPAREDEAAIDMLLGSQPEDARRVRWSGKWAPIEPVRRSTYTRPQLARRNMSAFELEQEIWKSGVRRIPRAGGSIEVYVGKRDGAKWAVLATAIELPYEVGWEVMAQ